MSKEAAVREGKWRLDAIDARHQRGHARDAAARGLAHAAAAAQVVRRRSPRLALVARLEETLEVDLLAALDSGNGVEDDGEEGDGQQGGAQ